jgi:FkbM family methyltransferase
MTEIARGSLRRWSTHPVAVRAAALAVSFAKTVQTRRLHWFTYDPRWGWTNRQPDVTFFSPDLFTATWGRLSALVDDYWCHGISLGAGDVVIDVGAGIGDHTLVFSRRVGKDGLVVAIEAQPETAQYLERTVRVNRLDNTCVFREAACDRETTVLISNGRAYEANTLVGTAGDIAVPGRPIDDMVAPLNLPKIDLVKMNIEGAEVMALAGMCETLRRTKAVVIACHDFLATAESGDPRRTKAAVMKILREAGFVVFTRPDAPECFVKDYVYGRRPVAS